MIFLLMFIFAVIRIENISGASISDDTSDIKIHQLFELIRTLIGTGSEDHEIPILDPYEMKIETFHLDSELFSANMNITNGILSGLSDFKLEQSNFSKTEIAIEINMSWPLIKFFSECYELEGNIKDVLPLLGHGVMDFEVHCFELWGKMYLKQSLDGKATLIDRVEKSGSNIGNVISRMGIDSNIERIFNAMVQDLLAGYLTRFSVFLAATYSDLTTERLNSIFEKLDSWDILSPIL